MRDGILGAVLAVAMAAACTADTATIAPAPSRGPVGGTLRLGMTNPSLWGMDPLNEWNVSTWELFRCCLVRTMMSYDVGGGSPDLRPVPDLAAAPPEISSDGLTWTFRLREGIRYAPPLDDVEITSGDFVRAITRAAHSLDPTAPELPSYLDMIEGYDAYVDDEATSIVGLQTPDAHTLRITTTRLDSALLYMLALPITAPIPPHPTEPDAPFGVASGYPDEHARPNGGANSYGPVQVASGPYMFEGAGEVDLTLPPSERTPPSGFTLWGVEIVSPEEIDVTSDGAITLVRNPSWRPEDDPLRAALADRIELVGGPPEDLFSLMETGELDIVFDSDPPAGMLRDYQEDPALRPLIQSPVGSLALIFAAFNVATPPFDDVAVRRAVAYAMDRTGLAEMYAGPTRVAQHFGPDVFEASMLASWSSIPGAGGHGDMTAAREEMRASRYATGDRCTDPACDGVRIVMRAAMEPGVPAFRKALLELGIDAEIELPPEPPGPYDCLAPEAPVAMCVGTGWSPDFSSAAQYLGAFFSSDGALPMTRLGATPSELRRWGYEVTRVPSLDDQIERCEQELGAGQAACWARLDQYVVTQLVPAVPMGYFATLRLSSPAIGPVPWDEVHLQPALERIPAPARET